MRYAILKTWIFTEYFAYLEWLRRNLQIFYQSSSMLNNKKKWTRWKNRFTIWEMSNKFLANIQISLTTIFCQIRNHSNLRNDHKSSIIIKFWEHLINYGLLLQKYLTYWFVKVVFLISTLFQELVISLVDLIKIYVYKKYD